MYKNTKINKTGTSSGMAHKWNLFMALLLFILSCPLLSIAEEAKPFDCTMPIIMEPVLKAIFDREHNKNIKTFPNPQKYPSSSWNFILSTHPLKDDNQGYEKMMEISYDIPSKNVFRLFIKDGIVMKLEHIEPSGKVNVYKQTILDKLEKMQFVNEEYTILSKKCTLAVYKNECLCLQLADGTYQAKIELQADENGNEIHFIGDLSLLEAKLNYKFSFYNKNLYLSVIQYSGEDRIRQLRGRPYYILRKGEYRNKTDYFIRSASVHDKQSDSGFDVSFHSNMGLASYSSNIKDEFGDMINWNEKGEETKRVKANEIKKLIKQIEQTVK